MIDDPAISTAFIILPVLEGRADGDFAISEHMLEIVPFAFLHEDDVAPSSCRMVRSARPSHLPADGWFDTFGLICICPLIVILSDLFKMLRPFEVHYLRFIGDLDIWLDQITGFNGRRGQFYRLLMSKCECRCEGG